MNEVTIPNKIQLPAVDVEPKITLAEAEAVAQDAGLAIIRVKKLSASAKIGKLIDQLGAKRIGRTTLVVAQESIESGIQQVDNAIAQMDGIEDPAPIVELIKIKMGFVDAMIKAGTAMIRSEEVAQPETGGNQLRVPFPPGSRVAVVAPDQSLAKPAGDGSVNE